MVARLVRDQKVVGSSPVASTKIPVSGEKCPKRAFLCKILAADFGFRLLSQFFWVVNMIKIFIKTPPVAKNTTGGKLKITSKPERRKRLPHTASYRYRTLCQVGSSYDSDVP